MNKFINKILVKQKERITLIILFAIAVPYFWLKYQPTTDLEESIENSRRASQNLNRVLSQPRNKKNTEDSLKLLIEAKEYQKANKLIDSMILELPKDYSLLDTKGQILLDEGKYRESIDYFTQAMKVTELESRTIRGHRAEAFTLIKQYDSAISDYKESSKLNRNYYLPLARTYEIIKADDSAIKYYRLYIALNPDSLNISKKINQLVKGE